MFAFKKEYFFIVENIKDINLSNKKKANKLDIKNEGLNLIA